VRVSDAMDELRRIDPGNVPAEQVDRLLAEIDPSDLSPELFRDLLAAASGATLDFSGVSPKAFAILISKASTDQIRAVSQSPAVRQQVLDEIFSRMAGQFRKDRGERTEAVVHWEVGDRPDGGTDEYQMVIEHGACVVTKGFDRDPRLTLSMGVVEFIKLVSGNGSPPLMFLTGKLKVRGDLAFAANMLGLFEIPKPT
jgi:putative sterol carrier protein